MKLTEFSKKYLKICGIGITVLAIVSGAFLLTHRSAYTSVSDSEAPILTESAEPTSSTSPIVMQENRELKPSAYTPEPTLEPTQPITFNENSHLNNTEFSENEAKQICTISVTCMALFPLDESIPKSEIVPKSGVLLEQTQMDFSIGESAFTILCKALRENNIAIEYTEATYDSPFHIKSIGNIAENDFGDGSEWHFTLNGESQSISCSDYILKNGDNIEIKYIR